MAVGHPSKSMHNVHVKASEGAESSGVTAFRNVACLVKYKQALSAQKCSRRKIFHASKKLQKLEFRIHGTCVVLKYSTFIFHN